MSTKANHIPHCAYVINYHLVWIPRYRKKVLVGPVEARLRVLLAEIATQYGFEILAVEVMPDHVYLFVSVPPRFSPAESFRLFQGITSRRLKNEFEILRRQYWGKNATLWAEGYYVGTAGHIRTELIKHYIEAWQKECFKTREHRTFVL
jgi:putative transposase